MMVPPIEDPAGRRVDARRNRERILVAAGRTFADARVGAVSMAEIARQAGIGQATLYRNFPTRLDLLQALYVGEIDDICAAATLDPDAVAADRLEAWLRRFYAYFVSKQPIAAELLAHTEPDDPVFGAGYARVIDAGRPLLAAAQDADGISRALSLEQILDLVIAIAKIPGEDAHRTPILETALASLHRP